MKEASAARGPPHPLSLLAGGSADGYEAGVSPDEVWFLHKALYGLRIAPRAWGLYRDRILTTLQILFDDATYLLKQSTIDSCLWLVYKQGCGEAFPSGCIVTYVDDFLLVACLGPCQAIINALTAVWESSSPENLIPGQEVEFCGLELKKLPSGTIVARQYTYIRRLLQRYSLLESNGISCTNMDGPASDDHEPDLKQLRELQGFAGELNWLATRTRVDLAYVVSVLSSALSKYVDFAGKLVKKSTATWRDTDIWDYASLLRRRPPP